MQGGLTEPLAHAKRLILEAVANDLGHGTTSAQSLDAVLQAGLLSYFAANDLYNAWQAGAADAVLYRAPSFGSTHTVLETEWVFGIPKTVHLAGIGLQTQRLAVQATDRS